MREDPRKHHDHGRFMRLVIARKNAWQQQGRKCAYCRTPLSRGTVTADHLIPLAKGGKTSQNNIVAACGPCNALKGKWPADKFLRLLLHPPRNSMKWLMAHARYRIWTRCEAAETRILALVGESATGRSAGVG